MRILVTGGAGFIGSHLCARLLQDGHQITSLDNFITGRHEHIDSLARNPNFAFIEHNISTPFFTDQSVDAVLHLASLASPVDYLRYPIPTLKVGALGTWHTLGLAKEKGARYLLTSTSEVYGDPLVHPQPETYWGNVNPVGPRGVYDESKRYAESMVMAYHLAHGVDTRVARIFNSVLADQTVVLFNDDDIHIEPIESYASEVGLSRHKPRSVLVPAFDPKTLMMQLRPAQALIKHFAHQEGFELRLRYGRSVKVTGDHSVFCEGPDGRPVAKPVRRLSIHDRVAIPAYLPVVERDRAEIDIAQELTRIAMEPTDLWDWCVRHSSFPEIVRSRRAEIKTILRESRHYRPTKNLGNAITCSIRNWERRAILPLWVIRSLNIDIPRFAEIAPYGGSAVWLPNTIQVSDDLLWFFGLFLAEGSQAEASNTYFVSLCSDEGYIHRAAQILGEHFKVHVGIIEAKPGRAPGAYAHSKVLHALICQALGLRERRIPGWVMQLPLSRAKHFLEGFRCGDGTHSGKKVGNELAFDTIYKTLAHDLLFLLMRFGIVGSLGSYTTTFKRKYGERRFPFHRVAVCELDNFDVLQWDSGVRQTLNARRAGDLVWAKVKEIRPCLVTGSVYDFSVDGNENFMAGTGVACHNTFGPGMRPDDGRAVPTFIMQALKDEPMTVHGDGSQTRSLCYIDDMVEGLVRLLHSSEHSPVNIGNPEEMTVLQIAELVRELCGSRSEIVFTGRPVDDPTTRQPDITRAREILGWEPKVPAREGLQRTIDWFRERLG